MENQALDYEFPPRTLSQNYREPGESILVARLRHTRLLEHAQPGLMQCALAVITEIRSSECVALNALGRIVGVVTNEDILGEIFRDFCIASD